MSRTEGKIRKQVEFLTDDYEWFISNHHIGDDTNRTGFSSIMSLLLHSYREVCTNPDIYKELTGVSLIDLTKAAAEKAKDEVEGA